MNYNNGKIYKLYITGIEDICYIGSTTETLSERLCKHRHQAFNDKQNKCVSHQLFQDNNEVVIELVEDYPCESKKELEERERFWIERYPDCINKNIPTRGWKERWYANHEHNLSKHREWLAKNKEYVSQKQKERRLANLDEARRKDRECRERRKEEANAHKREKVECPICKKMMNRNSVSDHKKRVHSE